MTDKINVDTDEGKTQKISKIHNRMKIMKTLNSPTRFILIGYLLVHRRLSLTKISKLVGKTKSTVIHHMKKLSEIGLIIEEEEEVVGSITPLRYYRISRDIIDKATVITDNVADIPDEKIVSMTSLALNSSRWWFESQRCMFEMMGQYYDDTILKINNKPDIAREFYSSKNNFDFGSLPLTDEGYIEYLDAYKEFETKMNHIVSRDLERIEEDGKQVGRPYFLVHAVIPFGKILENTKNQ